MEIAINGIAVSPGIAIGSTLTFGLQRIDVPRYEAADAAAEKGRFQEAIASVRRDIEALAQKTAQQLGPDQAKIFEAHLMVLEDVTFIEQVEARLSSKGLNAEALVEDVLTENIEALESVDDAHFRERARDFHDVRRRLLSKLLHTDLDSLRSLDNPSVIVAHDLSPSDTANLDLEKTLGIATDLGGPTSHTAILARALEIPAVVGLKYAGEHAMPGDTVIVDGTHGRVVIRPNATTLARMQSEKETEDERRRLLLRAESGESITLDQHPVPTLANIEYPWEVTHGLKNKAEGVGLYRTEYLFLNSAALPTEEEQYQAYAEVAKAVAPRPVVLRTLDLGGDKFVSHLQYAEEINPQLGWRAIRLCLERPDIFRAQLRAMLRASAHGNVQIMIPLISGVEEMEQVHELIAGVKKELSREGIEHDDDVLVGAMIEVPSAVLLADKLAQRCDFFSIGTNDLIQYSLAVDRVNEKIAHMYEPAHPAVIRMIHQTAQAARQAGIPCSVCGEMAGDPKFTEVLVGLGITSLSMSAVMIPPVRAEIGNLRFSAARRFARKLLDLANAQEIRHLMLERYTQRGTLDKLVCTIEPQPQAEQLK